MPAVSLQPTHGCKDFDVEMEQTDGLTRAYSCYDFNVEVRTAGHTQVAAVTHAAQVFDDDGTAADDDGTAAQVFDDDGTAADDDMQGTQAAGDEHLADDLPGTQAFVAQIFDYDIFEDE
jgi:hypothetical protein